MSCLKTVIKVTKTVLTLLLYGIYHIEYGNLMDLFRPVLTECDLEGMWHVQFLSGPLLMGSVAVKNL
jgi:hypothetical protein